MPHGENAETPLASRIIRCQNGDEQAFRELVVRHKKNVFLLARRLTGSREDAEDITQETFLRAFRNIGSVNPENGIELWLYKTTANLCSNPRRARGRRWRSHRAFAEMGKAGASRSGLLLRQSLKQALLRLSPSLRAAVTLVWLQGLTHREAAEVLVCSEGTVSWRVFEAKKRLRRALGSSSQAEATERRKGR